MKSKLTISKFIFGTILLITASNLNAQINYDLFSGPVNRSINNAKLPKSVESFNPTIKTYESPQTSGFVSDGVDVRVFPSANVQAEVHISINKTNPNNLVASCNTYIGNYNQGYYFTTDGGVTWNGADQLQNSPAQLYGDPSTGFGANGRAVLTTMNPSGGYLCQTSTNGGANWSALVSGTNQTNYDKEMIAVDNEPTSPYANNIYCAWSWLPYGLNQSSLNRVYFNKSADNGATFSSPIILKQGFGQGTNVQTGPNGEVYVCWADYNGDEDAQSDGLGFCKSLNGGNSFTTYQRALNYTGIRILGPNSLFGNTRVNDFPSMAVDKSTGLHRGRIYVAVPAKENGNGKAVIQVSFSDNQGASWSNLQTVSIPNGRQNWFPWITVDDCTGEVWVAYYSLDTNTGFETNTYVAHSTDAGITWESQKVSDVSHISAPINNNIFAAGYAGDYIGIAAHGGKAYAIWMDNRNGTWQLYCSPLNGGGGEITGPSNICTTGSFTFNAISCSATSSVIDWSVSITNPQVTVTPTTGNTTTVNANGYNGQVILTAKVYNGGVLVNTINKTIFLGAPSYSASYSNGRTSGLPIAIYYPNNPPYNYNNVCIGSTFPNVYAAAIPYGATNVVWSVPSGYESNTYGIVSQSNNRAYFAWNFAAPNPPAYLQATVTNSCGSYSNIFAFQQFNCGTQGDPCAFTKNQKYFTVSPNPTSSFIKIGIGNKPPPYECPLMKSMTTSKGIIFSTVNVYDRQGSLLKSMQQKDAKSATVGLDNLIAGSYTVEIISGDYKESHQIIVQK